MKLIDKKGKLFGRINVIDFSVIVVIVLLVLGAIYKFGIVNNSAEAGSTATQPINYKVLVLNTRWYSYDNIKVGDMLYDKTSGNSIGKIVDVSNEPAFDLVERPNGTALLGEVENRINIILTVEAEGIITSRGHFVNKTYELLIGAKKKFYTKYFECEASVSEIL